MRTSRPTFSTTPRRSHRRRLDGRIADPLVLPPLSKKDENHWASWYGATTRATSATPSRAARSDRAATADLHSRELSGLTACPAAANSWARRTVTGQRLGEPETGSARPARRSERQGRRRDRYKWTPSGNNASTSPSSRLLQVESDVARSRSTISSPSSFPRTPLLPRGLALFDTPIQAVSPAPSPTPSGAAEHRPAGQPRHTVWSPRTREAAASSIPGSTGNDFAPQDFSSRCWLASSAGFRRSMAGLLVTDRENDGGGHTAFAAPTSVAPEPDGPGDGAVAGERYETPDRTDLYLRGRPAAHLPCGPSGVAAQPAATGRGGPLWQGLRKGFFRADEGSRRKSLSPGPLCALPELLSPERLSGASSRIWSVRYIESPRADLIRRKTNPGRSDPGATQQARGFEVAGARAVTGGQQVLEPATSITSSRSIPAAVFSAASASIGILGDSIGLRQWRVGQGGDFAVFRHRQAD